MPKTQMAVQDSNPDSFSYAHYPCPTPPVHTWLARYTSRDDNNVTPLQTLPQLSRPLVTCDLGIGGTVTEVSSDPHSVGDIVQRQVCDGWVDLQQQGHGLPNAARSAQHCHLRIALESHTEWIYWATNQSHDT